MRIDPCGTVITFEFFLEQSIVLKSKLGMYVRPSWECCALEEAAGMKSFRSLQSILGFAEYKPLFPVKEVLRTPIHSVDITLSAGHLK